MLSKLIQTTTKLFFLLAISSVLFSCSSKLRLLDYWTSENFRDHEDMKFLVVCFAENPEMRDYIELEIAQKLRKKKMSAGESHKIFPNLERSLSQSELQKYREIAIDSGYNGVVVTALKNIIESYKEGVSITDQSAEEVSPDHLSLTYVIEAQVFDLNRSGENELVGVNLVAVTDPVTTEELVKSYSRIIGRHFKNETRQ